MIERQTDRARPIETKRERQRQRQTETDKERESERERERDNSHMVFLINLITAPLRLYTFKYALYRMQPLSRERYRRVIKNPC